MSGLTLTHAMILAAGLGTRMRPLTDTLPKPLIPVAGTPLIDHCLAWLTAAGVEEVVVNSSYRAEQLEAHLHAREQAGQGPHVTLSREGFPPLETGGGVRQALPLLGQGPFITLNSDAIFMPPEGAPPHILHRMAAAWADELDFLMLLIPTDRAIGWEGSGDFLMDEAGRIRRPEAGEPAPYIFSGVEIIHPRVFEEAPEGAFSLGHFWKTRREPDGYHRAIRAMVYDGDWLNVGDLKGLKAAQLFIPAGSR